MRKIGFKFASAIIVLALISIISLGLLANSMTAISQSSQDIMNNEVEKINLIHGIYEDYLDMYMNVYAHVNAKLLRTMDKRAEDIVERFARGETQVLIGTQMVAKGLDFENVTLVGALAADLSLYVENYRAAERTFQLLTQAAGRAGRGDVPGEVVIQTYQPEHYSIVHAAAQDYEGFYEEEILYREIGAYPPAAHMLAVLVTGKEPGEAKNRAAELAALARREAADGKLTVMGPGSASLSKLNDCYRFVFYIKGRDDRRLSILRDSMEQYIQSLQKCPEQVQFDVDPINGY